jgi:hypothetical protein
LGEGGAVKLALIACLLAGCTGGTFDKVSGQDLAIEIVWRGLYGETGDPPPIEWFHGDDVLFDTGTKEVQGWTLPGWKIQVAISHQTCSTNGGEPWDCSISASGLRHELMHAHTYNRTGDIDAAHWRGDWDLADNVAFTALWNARR